jgi:uncharacterized protein YqhQ
MMRSLRWWAIAVRRPQGSIHTESHRVGGYIEERAWLNKPLVRGVLALGEAMSIGVRALAISARYSSGEEGEELTQREIRGAIAFAFVFFIALFIVLPALVVRGGEGGSLFVFEASRIGHNLREGGVRIGIFLGYVLAISLIRDVRRVFQYHGAEHKVIAAVETTGEASAAAAKPFSTVHVRCGTNFLFLVMLLAVVVFSFVGRSPWWWRVSSRILLLPLVASISYETLRIAARHHGNLLVRAITWPGLLLQRITTREPSDDQLEVAVAAMHELMAREGMPPPGPGPAGGGPDPPEAA